MTDDNLLRYEMQRGNIYRVAFQNFIRYVSSFNGEVSSVGVNSLKDADEKVAKTKLMFGL